MRSLLLLFLVACDDGTRRQAAFMTGGDPDRGKAAISKYGCSSCHHIKGVPGAVSKEGPPLDDIASRVYLAGQLPNQPENMLRWIMHPHAIVPRTVMPEMGVSETDGRDISA